MIVQEIYETLQDGKHLIRTYSDAGFKIRQIETQDIYDEAIDIGGDTEPFAIRFHYEETDEPIETGEEDIIEEEFEPEEIIE